MKAEIRSSEKKADELGLVAHQHWKVKAGGSGVTKVIRG